MLVLTTFLEMGSLGLLCMLGPSGPGTYMVFFLNLLFWMEEQGLYIFTFVLVLCGFWGSRLRSSDLCNKLRHLPVEHLKQL